MSYQRGLIRLSSRLPGQLRAQTLRTPLQRRLQSSNTETVLKGNEDNAFNRERQDIKDHASATSDLWRKLSLYVAVPCLIVASINAYNLWVEHWNHWDHMPPLEERVQYPYMNIRNKKFPFGDGDKTLFWNPKVNYKPED